MATRTTMNISLTPELESFVSSRVASGRYQSASEVVRAALRLLEEQELTRKSAHREARTKIAAGLEQAERGELLDGEERKACDRLPDFHRDIVEKLCNRVDVLRTWGREWEDYDADPPNEAT